MKICQIINEAFGFLGSQLILILLIIRAHIAMTTFQIAGFGGIPYHHRPHALTGTISHGMGILGISQRITIVFSGGEPLIRPDFFALAEYAQAKGVRPTLSTDGTLITREVAQRIKDIGVGYVGISLDGLQDVNDQFRGVEGAFQKAMAGIQNCVAVGQRVGLRFTINHHNIQELENIFDFIERENINRVCFYHLVYSGRGTAMKNQDVTAEESRRAMDIIIRRTKDFEDRGLEKEILTVDNHCDGVSMYLKAVSEGNDQQAAQIKKYISMNGGNRSGIAFGEVDPFGYVLPDQFTQHHTFGNVRDRKFSEIWQDTSNPIMAGLKDRKPLLKGRCSQCRFLENCNGNFRTRAEAVTGDFWESDPSCYLTDEEIGIAGGADK